MAEEPDVKKFASSAELLAFLRDKVDDIDSVLIPVQEAVQVRGPDGDYVMNGVGALLKLCNGRRMAISRDDAAMLINDGVLQRLKIKCVLDPLKK